MMSPNEGFWISRYVKNKIVHISKMQTVNTKAKKEEKMFPTATLMGLNLCMKADLSPLEHRRPH